jgi:hypothetical protein
MLTLKDAACQIGVSEAAIVEAVQNGVLPAKLLVGGEYGIEPEDLLRFQQYSQIHIKTILAEQAEIAAQLSAAEAQLQSMLKMLDNVKRQQKHNYQIEEGLSSDHLLSVPEPPAKNRWWNRLAG